MDHPIDQIYNALMPNLNALVLATDSNHIFKADSVDFVASWTSIQRYTTNLAILIVSGVPLTAPNGSWVCSQSLRTLDITSAPGLTCMSSSVNSSLSVMSLYGLPGLDLALHFHLETVLMSLHVQNCQLVALALAPSLALVRPRTPRRKYDDYYYHSSPQSQFPTTSLPFLSRYRFRRHTIPPRNDHAPSSSHLSEYDLVNLLKQPSTFIGLSQLVVGNEGGMTG